ncbi:MAG: efflux transporter outer membrane subunit [Planctomycetota bacterium]|jgi:multidrug efflux system outer membrane protein
MKRLLNSICYRLIITVVLVSSGCMVGPNYTRPDTAAQEAGGFVYSGKHKQDVKDLFEINNWWQRFGDKTTVELVEKALENNYDLKAAAARVLQANAALAEAKGVRLPEVSYNLRRDRSKRSFKFQTQRFSNLSTTFTQDITISYVLDLFGKLKRTERAALADLLSAEFNEKALVNSIIATVVNPRVRIATFQKRLFIAKANTQNWQRNLDIIEGRYERGLVGPLDVRLARENLATSQAAEITIEQLLIMTRNGLDVLVGRRPGTGKKLERTLPDLPQLEPVPVGLPAYLLDRRPDVRTAEMALKAANERIGVSIAQLYPDLTLSGTVGRSADRWRDIWEHETEIYSAVFNLAQPIFKGGQIRAGIDKAKAVYKELTANYAQTVLTAMQEVEDALIAEEMLQRRLNALENRFAQAKAAEKLANERYLRGVEKLITLLVAERGRRIAEDELAGIKEQLWIARVNLFLALGGDWNSREDAKAKNKITGIQKKAEL